MKVIGRGPALTAAGWVLIVFATLRAAWPSPLAAQEAPWEFAIAPYLWATGMRARVSAPSGASSHHLEAKFKDIIENLDGVPVIVAGEIRNGRLALVADLVYLPLGSRVETRNLLFNDGKSETSTLMVAVAAFYRVAKGPDIDADVGAGFRLWSISSHATLNAGLLPAVSTKFDKTFVDPIIGVQATLALSERWRVTGYFDLGAFGVSSSKLTWQLLGTVDYRAADWIDLRAGWRHLGVERDNVKINLTGPIVGAIFRF
jgi:hypothetical protein